MRFWADLRRIAHIVSVLARHLLAYMVGARLERWPWLARRLPSGTLPGPERLRMVFEDVGGTFIKLGQMLALQPDILSLEYCNALFKLLDRILPLRLKRPRRPSSSSLGEGRQRFLSASTRSHWPRLPSARFMSHISVHTKSL